MAFALDGLKGIDPRQSTGAGVEDWFGVPQKPENDRTDRRNFEQGDPEQCVVSEGTASQGGRLARGDGGSYSFPA